MISCAYIIALVIVEFCLSVGLGNKQVNKNAEFPSKFPTMTMKVQRQTNKITMSQERVGYKTILAKRTHRASQLDYCCCRCKSPPGWTRWRRAHGKAGGQQRTKTRAIILFISDGIRPFAIPVTATPLNRHGTNACPFHHEGVLRHILAFVKFFWVTSCQISDFQAVWGGVARTPRPHEVL